MSSAALAADDWVVRGSYFEACNCDAICPCRTIDGMTGGRSTHGVCYGALSWRVEDGEAAGVDLSGTGAVITYSYSDDEPGSPWTLVLYVDGPDELVVAWRDPSFARALTNLTATSPYTATLNTATTTDLKAGRIPCLVGNPRACTGRPSSSTRRDLRGGTQDFAATPSPTSCSTSCTWARTRRRGRSRRSSPICSTSSSSASRSSS